MNNQRRLSPASPAIWLIRAYQRVFSPMLGRNCRFSPTCSAYTAEALAPVIASALEAATDEPDAEVTDVTAAAAEGESLSEGPDGCDWDAPAMIDRAEADVMLEMTYTDIKTGQPATAP